MTVFFLILLSHVYNGETAVVVPLPYKDELACHTAGKMWADPGSFLQSERKYKCMPVYQ